MKMLPETQKNKLLKLQLLCTFFSLKHFYIACLRIEIKDESINKQTHRKREGKVDKHEYLTQSVNTNSYTLIYSAQQKVERA